MNDVAQVIEASLDGLFPSNNIGVTWHFSSMKFTSDFNTHPRVIDISGLEAYQGALGGTDISAEEWLNGSNARSPDATQFNHNVYIASDSRNVVARGNIFARSSASGIQARPGGILENNLIFEAVGNHVGRTSTTPVPGGVNGTWKNNVVLNATFTSGTDSRGGNGLEVDHTNQFSVEGNIVAHSEIKNTGLIIGGAHDGHKNTTVENNIVYDAGLPLGPCCYEEDFNYSSKTVFVRDNIFENLELSESPWNDRIVIMKHATDDYSGHFEFRNNRYWNLYPDKWFSIKAFSEDLTFADWNAHVDDVGSVAEETLFLDSQRNVDSYDSSIGGSGTFDSFISEAKSQSRFNWNSNYTASAVNDYIREGFEPVGLSPEAGGDEDKDSVQDSGSSNPGSALSQVVSWFTGNVIDSGITGRVAGEGDRGLNVSGIILLVLVVVFFVVVFYALKRRPKPF